MATQYIKCNTCGGLFNPAFLDQVFEYEHDVDLKINTLHKSIQVEKRWPESPNVARTKYISSKQVMEIEYKNGKIYHYQDFPLEVWKALLNSVSIGSFLAREVKGNYRYVAQN